mmetsp:Transcript_51396/g.116881  ORF Transcript_51396/g.116881 Transcript_51396/m.116881 type:complete len:205 (+) Transcript_51396:1875-2489(+)
MAATRRLSPKPRVTYRDASADFFTLFKSDKTRPHHEAVVWTRTYSMSISKRFWRSGRVITTALCIALATSSSRHGFTCSAPFSTRQHDVNSLKMHSPGSGFRASSSEPLEPAAALPTPCPGGGGGDGSPSSWHTWAWARTNSRGQRLRPSRTVVTTNTSAALSRASRSLSWQWASSCSSYCTAPAPNRDWIRATNDATCWEVVS